MKKIIKAGNGEFIDKKSRFIAYICNIESEEQAVKIISEIKKKYWDARHNCYAYILGDNNEVQRFSDDGEPSGTAGKPILEVITGNECSNCLCVVTRYFGGVLLGTGGLIRAYTNAAKDALDNSRTDSSSQILRIEKNDKNFAFSCLPYTASEIENALHHEELPPARRTVLCVYGAVRGVGGIDSWGTDVEEEYHISAEDDKDYSFSIC